MNRLKKPLIVGVVICCAPVATVTLAEASKRHSKPNPHHSHVSIPQHNGGDRDHDNNGGPSDGDGDL